MQNRRKLQPGLQLALGFLLIIVTGAVLLYLPLSHQDGVEISFLDSFFVSTSAVCVTGLTPVDISKTLSDFGSFILMLLIQLGGLGYAVLAVLIIRLASGKIEGPSVGYPSIDQPWLPSYSDEKITYTFPEKSIYQLIYDNLSMKKDQVAFDIRSSANGFTKGIKVTYGQFLK